MANPPSDKSLQAIILSSVIRLNTNFPLINSLFKFTGGGSPPSSLQISLANNEHSKCPLVSPMIMISLFS